MRHPLTRRGNACGCVGACVCECGGGVGEVKGGGERRESVGKEQFLLSDIHFRSP